MKTWVINAALALAIAITLTACATSKEREFKAWSEAEKARAEAGEISWSSFYKEGYDRLASFPPGSQGVGFAMLLTNTLLDAAIALESGKLDKPEFESMRRKAKAEYAMYLERTQQEQQALYNQWLASQAQMQSLYKQPRAINCNSTTFAGSTNTTCR